MDTVYAEYNFSDKKSLARYKLSNRLNPLGQINSDPYSLDNNFLTMKEKKKCILQISS